MTAQAILAQAQTQAQAHARSWYADTANPHPRRPELIGDTACDVCVIGGGYTGLMAALTLAERGYDVVLLEAERMGWGASGRNGGQIVSGFSPAMHQIARRVGAEDARRLWDMSEEAKQILRDRVARHAIACDLRPGHLVGALKPRHRTELAEYQRELERDYGYRGLRLIERDAIRGMVQSEAFVGGLLDTGGGQLHPLNYALGLAEAAAGAGVRLFEGSRVTRLDTGPAPIAATARGSVRARFIVLAGNAYLGGLVPKLAGAIMPVGTAIIATEPLGAARAQALIPADIAVADANFIVDYFRRTPDHRLLFGGGAAYSGLTRPDIAHALRRAMVTIFPQLADVGIAQCWGGFIAISSNRLPHFGRLGPNTFFAHGFSGHGVALTGLAGTLIAEAVAGTAERFDVFARIPHRTFPGGRLLRTPLLMAAMLWYRLRDRL